MFDFIGRYNLDAFWAAVLRAPSFCSKWDFPIASVEDDDKILTCHSEVQASFQGGFLNHHLSVQSETSLFKNSLLDVMNCRSSPRVSLGVCLS